MLIVESWLDSDRTWYHKLSAIVIFLYIKSIPHPFVNIQEERIS